MDAERNLLIQRLHTDLVGPLEETEVLDGEYPGDVYLTGILWPKREPLGEEEDEKLDAAGPGSGAEEGTEGAAEEVTLADLRRPCSAGLSFAVAAENTPHLHAELNFAVYQPQSLEEKSPGGTAAVSTGRWVRRPYRLERRLTVAPSDKRRHPVREGDLPEGISLYVRSSPTEGGMVVTVVVINEMSPHDRDRESVERVTMFQVGLRIRAGDGTRLVAKPRAGKPRDDREERSAALLYRHCRVFAVGHTCSADWEADPESTQAKSIAIAWLPQYEVPRVSAEGHEVFERLTQHPRLRCLEAEWLGTATAAEVGEALNLLVTCYSGWIDLQAAQVADLDTTLKVTALENLETCRRVRARIQQGVADIVGDAALLESFQLANRAIQRQHEWDRKRDRTTPFAWRPFQLAFILLAGPSACNGLSADRNVMDLLWFPTGGGKTEAYLGIIAMTAFYRRLARPDPDAGAGVAAIMRYTLRLLTTQQFVRAAALILSCESLRRGVGLETARARRLGNQPFSIGLWLGGDATPNRYREAQEALQSGEGPTPKQLLRCPCCDSVLQWKPRRETERIEVHCTDKSCALAAVDSLLPVWTVDSDLYRERPTLLIGTVDKFAQIARRDEVRRLFAFGQNDSPDLIIQDELHLISGPLGTIAALYEMALDWLWSREGMRPKVIGSTATIRHAGDQARALFDRDTEQFPPAALDQFDTGFAVRDQKKAGRLYVGVTTSGRSAKFTLQAVAGCLLQAVEGAITNPGRRDSYSTLVTYFNSLRELGGALVLMQDDVHDSIRLYKDRHKEMARVAANIQELTSRRSQEDVRDMLDKLAVPYSDEGTVDVVLATSMLSVGVDIGRLGLMLVNGQPKMRSEYIQASSRVGRDKDPGLVVAVLNNAKARDRSHYETFPSWHQSLYREVEVTSVTPFAPRARDRALPAVLAAMVRHGVQALHASPKGMDVNDPTVVATLREIERRAGDVDATEPGVGQEIQDYLRVWHTRNPAQYWNDYAPRDSLLQSAEKVAAKRAIDLAPGAAWSALNNMRSVEPTVRFRLTERLSQGGPARLTRGGRFGGPGNTRGGGRGNGGGGR